MDYRAELGFLCACMRKSHIQVLQMAPAQLSVTAPDLGLRRLIGSENGLCTAQVVSDLREHTVYMLEDEYACRYVFFLLPQTERILLIGPFLRQAYTMSKVLELAEKRRFSPKMATELSNFFAAVPVMPEDSYLAVVLSTFLDVIWPDHVPEIVEVDIPEAEFRLPVAEDDMTSDLLWKMEMMEKRYNYENEMMDAVAKGQSHKAAMLFPVFSNMSFEQRINDPLRNAKNYCIIMNTLLRKSAEGGGVHPLFLDQVSSEYARKIETIVSMSGVPQIMREMFERYCRLVKKHATQRYSPQVQKVILTVEAGLSADLSLSSLAKLQGISAGYLSRLFKNETGMNITEYVNQRRIERAAQLILYTRLQIQTIAQHCGILDVQYFSRLFRKIKGCSPMEYRRRNHDLQ